ncbi:MAG: RES family NAD+ phosphorylase [Cellvibrionales bacterium]|nr:RES family NAD+ phosphorylase [Cellvibrionales bacterium]
MQLYRISHEKFLKNLSGTGASYQEGARWNSAGYPVVYFAGSVAVAMLELANYIPNPRLIPKGFKLGVYKVQKPMIVEEIDINTLPAHWNQFPYHLDTRAMGDQWLEGLSAALLKLPSASVPNGLEPIYLMNPRHQEAAHIELIDIVDQIYNERLFSGL